ncbi:MAG: sigma-70 family RNA polymerase sigma factor [Candidatus Omnitrophica bacterium]|nr:sigma-70 family RNA polymerase sigma factor [Candidatus Omnitrophota bacterium]
MDEDSGYIARFKSGDLEGFEMLVKKYQGKALNIAYSLTSNLSSAQDVAQEAFIKIYNNLHSFRFESKFSSWFYRIVVNSAYDFLRKNKYQPISMEDPACPELSLIEENPDPLAKELVGWALSKVPFKYRSALILREIEGLSYGDISRSLGVGVGTVESRIFRGRKILKDILLEKGVFKDAL